MNAFLVRFCFVVVTSLFPGTIVSLATSFAQTDHQSDPAAAWARQGFDWIPDRKFSANRPVAFVIPAAFIAKDGGGVPSELVQIQSPAAPPAVNMTEVARTIAAATRGFECARVVLQPTSSDAATLRGWVAHQADLDSLNAVPRMLPATLRLTSVVALRPWPQCEALLIVSDAVSISHDMVLATIGHEGAEYQAGSRLILKLRTPDFPSYLYVTYLPASGGVVSLYQPPGVVPQALPPRTIVNLGGGDDSRAFKVGPPFGMETVIAVATASPLFGDGPPSPSTARDYLAALRRTLVYKPDPSQPGRLVDAKVLALTTRDRAP